MSWLTAIRNEIRQEQAVIGSYLPRSSHGTYEPQLSTRENDLITRVVDSGRTWEKWLVNYFQEYCRADATSIDVGANIGVHTRTLAAFSKSVIALEPQRDIYDLLVENTREFTHVTTINAAASTSERPLGMQHRSGNRGASRITTSDPDEIVDAIRLDDLVIPNPVALIKIDVEGHEGDVLRGGLSLIDRDQPVILLEDRTRARCLLKEHGYRIKRISLFDFLCLPRSR